MTKELFYPLIDSLLHGLPHTYKNVEADEGIVVQLTIATAIGGDWYLIKAADKWQLSTIHTGVVAAQVIMEPDIAWKLFPKGISPETAR